MSDNPNLEQRLQTIESWIAEERGFRKKLQEDGTTRFEKPAKDIFSWVMHDPKRRAWQVLLVGIVAWTFWQNHVTGNKLDRQSVRIQDVRQDMTNAVGEIWDNW